VGKGDFVAEAGRFNALPREELLVEAGEIGDTGVALQQLRDLVDGVTSLLLHQFQLDLFRLEKTADLHRERRKGLFRVTPPRRISKWKSEVKPPDPGLR
jgi:hypothetical protein